MSRRPASNSTVASSVARFTVACTPSSAFSPRSTRLAQPAHVIPSTSRRTRTRSSAAKSSHLDHTPWRYQRRASRYVSPRWRVMPAKRATTPGTTACAIVMKRYGNHGTVTSRLFLLDRVRDRPRDRRRVDDEPAQHRAPQHGLLREALGLDEARHDRVHAHAAAAQQRRGRARERELRVLCRAVRARRRERDGARDRDDVDDVRVARGLQAGQERAQAPDPAEVVDLRDALDQLRVDRP